MDKKTVIKKVKIILLMLLSLAFTIAGIIGINNIGWFPAAFFGICFFIFVYIFFNPPKEYVDYNELLLSSTDNKSIDYYDWGFYHNESKLKIYWYKIHAITAFKKDLITSDEIYVSLEHEFDVLNISESFEGWEEFRKELSKQFSLTDTKWFEKMTGHAFENDEIILYKKQMAK